MVTTMILFVLAVVWVVALTPMVLRKMSERKFTSGVRSYRQRLLRLGSLDQPGTASELSAGSVPGAMIGYSVAAQRLQVDRYGAANGALDIEDADRERAGAVVPLTPSPLTTARRRRVITVLAGATVFSFLVGLIPGAGVMWDLALIGLICIVAYVAMLIHFNRLAVERAQKVIALETRRHATEVLQSRRYVASLEQDRHAVGGSDSRSAYGGAGYSGSRYPSAQAPILGGTGWSVMQPRRTANAR